MKRYRPMTNLEPKLLLRRPWLLAGGMWLALAVVSFSQAQAEKELDAKALAKLAYEKTTTAKTEKDFQEIITLCERAAAQEEVSENVAEYIHRLQSWAHNQRGEWYAEQGEAESALLDFERSAKLDPTRWRALHNRGVSLAMAGKFEQALADLNRTIELHQEYANAYFNRGEVLKELGQVEEALEDYGQAIRLRPRDPELHGRRGDMLYRLRRYTEALASYQQAIRLDPRSAVAHTDRADALSALGYYAEAARHYQQAIRLDAEYGRAYQGAAWIMATSPEARFRNPQLALRAARKAIDLDGEEDYRYLDTLAAALAANSQFEEAEEVAAHAVELAPEEFRAASEARLELYRDEKPYREPPRVGNTPRRGRRR